ncbi:hypothetical protein D9615_000832 [Tricholomella constricta]|uniref:DnaJ homologue subfamily C member 28 conserved domain-containing protein n=1 Tax=Tricholomella constricta TaxID=117010 RepID=A0A8H5MBJ0_9AGAR|nr:hypothetical protein D9615_000832 [Tricholomella constricta]
MALKSQQNFAKIPQIILPLHRSHPRPTSCFVHSRNTHSSASDKLFADAAREEAQADSQPKKSARLSLLENEHENWDGDERIQDAVLRMLVDKYKPLRTGDIQSADQKLKLTPPRVRPAGGGSDQVIITHTTPSQTGSWATEPLFPERDHQPWHTEFKAPAHADVSIKQACFPPSPPPPPPQPSVKPAPVDDRARRKEKEEKKRMEHAGRLMKARESTLDYRLGVRGSGSGSGTGTQVNPVSMKGWTSLVEDKIEKARKAGLFQNVKGRGQPLVPAMEESNPFIAREEFLMNRIVQRNGAAPPWVEVQGELDTAVTTFREILRQSWIRRVVRVMTMSTPPALLHTFTIGDIKAFRDAEWEQRERSYHQLALEELNALVRKYNGLAPYAVRRPYYIYSVEMEKLFEGCVEEILHQLTERAHGGESEMEPRSSLTGSTSSSGGTALHGPLIPPWRIRDFLRAWLEGLLARLWPNRRRRV